MNNVILKDDYIIGYTNDIKDYIKKEINNFLNISGKIEDGEKEAIKDMIDLYTELHNTQDNYTLLKIAPHPMGGYTIEEMEA